MITNEKEQEKFLQKIYLNFDIKFVKKGRCQCRNKFLCKCKKCEREQIRMFTTLKDGTYKCKFCREVKKIEDVLKELKTKNLEYVSGKYINNKSKIFVKCLKCGSLLNGTFNHFMTTKGNGCRVCQYNKMRKTDKEFKQELNKTHNGKIIAIDEYKGINKPITLKCTECNNIWVTTPFEVINKHIGCGQCSKGKSYPNKIMKEILLLKSDKYSSLSEELMVSKIDNTIKRQYRYDFCIEQNGKKIIIEMDGGFHKFSRNLDKIKDEIAIKNGYDIIRIDCNYKSIDKRFNTIKNNLLKSKLNEILSLDEISNDEWTKINNKACSKTMYKAYKYYLDNSDKSQRQCARELGMNPKTLNGIIRRFRNNDKNNYSL